MHAFDGIMRHIGPGRIIGQEGMEVGEQFMPGDKTLPEKPPHIPMVGKISVSYPIMQAPGHYPQEEQQHQDPGPDPAIPDQGDLRNDIAEDSAVKNKYGNMHGPLC
jgi:hypothetical protein